MAVAKICNLCKKEDVSSCCGGCKSVFYCNRECQTKDWSNHKLECKKIRSQTSTATAAQQNASTATQANEEKQLQAEDGKLDMDRFVFTLPEYDNKLIRIQHTNTKHGFGMIANVAIKRGTIIYSEHALMSLSDAAKQNMALLIKQQYLLLSEAQKNIYKSLARNDANSSKQKKNEDENENESDNKKENEAENNRAVVDNDDDESKLVSIWNTNQIELTANKGTAIFPLLARVNHACDSNAHWIWNEKSNEQRLIALHDIDKDTEILVNYCGEQPMVSLERSKKLKSQWNIEACSCRWCGNEKIRNKLDSVIEEYQSLDASLESLMSDPLSGYKSAQKLVKIVEKHFNANPVLMDKHCYDAGQFALGLQKWNEATFYLETAFKQKQLAQGEDIEIGAEYMEKVNILPNAFRSKFKKFDPKYRARLNKKVEADDDAKQKANSNKNGKVQQSKDKAKNKQTGKSKGKGKDKKKSNQSQKGKKKKSRK